MVTESGVESALQLVVVYGLESEAGGNVGGDGGTTTEYLLDGMSVGF